MPGMSQRSTNHLPIVVPPSFPSAAYEDYRDVATRIILEASDEIWIEFQSACEGVAWRYRAFCEYADNYKSQYEKISDIENIYLTDKFLFGLFINAVSTVECLSYSVWSLLSAPMVLSVSFTSREKRGCNPASLCKLLQTIEGAGSLHAAVEELDQSTTWQLCTSLRNRMTHRSKMPRITSIGLGPPSTSLAETTSTEQVKVDADFVNQLIAWLSDTIATMCTECRILATTVHAESAAST